MITPRPGTQERTQHSHNRSAAASKGLRLEPEREDHARSHRVYNFTCSMISSSLERRIAAIRSNGSLVILRTRLKTIIWERGGAVTRHQ